MSTEALGTLTPSEQAYFENGGDTAIDSGVPETEEPANTEAAAEVEQPTNETNEGDKPEGEKPVKTVPLAALHEERQRARELRERTRQLEEQMRIGNERLQQLARMAQGQQPQLPALDQDPVTNIHTRLSQIEQMTAQQVQAQQAEVQRQAAMQHLQSELNVQESEYRQINPDYDNAVKFLGEVEVRSLMALGYPQAQAAQMVHNQFGAMAWQLRQAGQDIPSRVYALAEARGYAKAKPVSAQEKLNTAQRGVQASRSLGSGGQVKNNLDLAALASMPADEFDALTKDDKAWRRLMGG
jgi:hypothetical protein